MEYPLISVIVPTYNTELYITECVNSILAQTYSNLEIILIDDGSTDLSGKMCDELSQKDKRIVVIHQKNQGQGAARNNAVLVAKGSYIAFVDSDDVIDKNYIEVLYSIQQAVNAEIVCCTMQKFKKNIVRRKRNNSRECVTYTSAEAIEVLLQQGELTNSPCCKLICTKVVKANLFPVNIGYEDFAVVYKWFAAAEKIAYVPYCLYYYRQVDNSTMHLKFSNKKLDRIRIVKEMRLYIDEHYPQLKSAMDVRFFLANIQTLMWLPISKKYKPYYKEINENIKEVRKSVISNSKAKKSLRIMAVISYCGIGLYRMLGGIYRRLFSE